MGFTVDAGNTQRVPVAAGESVTVTTRRVAFVTAQSGLGLTPGSNIGSVSQGTVTYGPYPAGFLTVLALGEAATVRNIPAPAGESNAVLGIVAKPTITTPAVAGTSISGAFSAVGTPAPSTAIAWLLDDVVISGATAIPYASQASDSGKALKLRVTVTNTSGTLVSDSDAVTVAAGAQVATLRQVATGSFLADAIDATNQHGAFSYPFTNKVALAAGAELSIKFANIALLNNIETNGTGVFTIKGLAVEINGAVYPATLSKATAAGGEIAEAKLVLPVALPVGVFRMNYALSDTGGLRQFQFYTHKSSPGSKAVVGASSAPTDQVNVVGGGTLTAVAAGQSYAILPTAIDAIHASKVCAIMGSSTGTGRSDTTAPGAGVQSYMGRGVDNAGFPVKNLALSGDRAENQLAGGTFRTSQLYGVTHVILVTGGNDIRGNGKTAAQTWGYVNGIIDQLLAFNSALKIGVVVLTPVVTGDPAFVSSQTPDATNGIRVQYNTGLTANNAIPKANKIINVNTVVENVANPENGRFNANYTTDGTHVNSTGCLPASQMPDWADFMAM